jgi:hypothetical protein
VHGHHQATAAGNPPAAATPSRHPSDDLPMDLFVDLASGWTCWVPRWPNGAEQAAGEGPTAAAQHPCGQGWVVGLLGWIGAWLGGPCAGDSRATGV